MEMPRNFIHFVYIFPGLAILESQISNRCFSLLKNKRSGTILSGSASLWMLRCYPYGQLTSRRGAMQSSCLGISHVDSPMILVPMIKWFRVKNHLVFLHWYLRLSRLIPVLRRSFFVENTVGKSHPLFPSWPKKRIDGLYYKSSRVTKHPWVAILMQQHGIVS